MIPVRGPQTRFFSQLDWPGLGYLGLGTQAGDGKLATGNPEMQAIGSWARYLGLGT